MHAHYLEKCIIGIDALLSRMMYMMYMIIDASLVLQL